MDWQSEEGRRILAEAVSIKSDDPTQTWREIANQYGLTKAQLKRAHQRHGSKIAKGKVTFENMRRPDDDAIEDYIEALLDYQAAQDGLDTKQVEATITLDDNRPIGLAFTGDWHTGGLGVDYDLLDEDTSIIEQTNGLYVAGTGDYKENYTLNAPPSGMFEQIIQPGMQDVVVRHYIRRIGERLVVVVRGCHDDWDKRGGDKDFISVLCEDANAINFWHGGTLTIRLGDQEYTGHIRHKYKYESSLNTTNAQRRMMEIYGSADFAMLGHLHNPQMDERHLMGDYRILGRSGSYKVWDEHGQKVGGYKGKPGIPIIVFWPNEHKMVPFRDFRTGIEFLKFVRGG